MPHNRLFFDVNNFSAFKLPSETMSCKDAHYRNSLVAKLIDLLFIAPIPAAAPLPATSPAMYQSSSREQKMVRGELARLPRSSIAEALKHIQSGYGAALSWWFKNNVKITGYDLEFAIARHHNKWEVLFEWLSACTFPGCESAKVQQFMARVLDDVVTTGELVQAANLYAADNDDSNDNGGNNGRDRRQFEFARPGEVSPMFERVAAHTAQSPDATTPPAPFRITNISNVQACQSEQHRSECQQRHSEVAAEAEVASGAVSES